VSNNDLKYTSLTVDDILKQVYDRFLKNPDKSSNHKFDNFRESAIAQTLIEIFAGTVDITNYYIQRRAEECYFDTAQLKSSVISLSRMFGYVMNRKEPSRAKIRMIIEGNIEDNQVQIPYYSKFSYDGNPYVLVNTMTYRIPNETYKLMNDESVITIDKDSFDNTIDIVQGTIKEKVFLGATNSQINAPFQIYKIEDKDFSNVYGDKDFFYNDVTQVYVGENKITSDDNTNTRFKIDRRSLLNWETINTSDLSKSQSVCVIRTSTDGFVEILFGDGNDNVNTLTNPTASGGFARKGALTRKDNIYVQYLACEGKSTNKNGVIGDKVDFSGKIFNSNGKDITSKISFELISNIYGGADDESMDSIKYSAPKIYYSLDRLVTKGDYIAYLKSLTSPIDIKNAVAWGEQEERDLAFKFALAKMFNVTLFSVTGSLYDTVSSPHVPKTGESYDDVVLDLNYSPYEFQTQGYFNVYVIQEMVNQLNRYRLQTEFYEVIGEVINTSIDDYARTIKNSLQNLSSIRLNFKYTSDKHQFTSNIISDGYVEIKGFNNITASGEDYLKALADKINTALVEFKDYRGNKVDNENFDKVAFIGRGFGSYSSALFFWDTITENNNGTFRLRFSDSDEKGISPCYITEFNNDDITKLLNLNGSKSLLVVEDVQVNELNGKIANVVRDLNNRSQVNIKNIYVSPIIHRFNLVGDVYVKPLYDKEDVKNQILDEMYIWLDINADFNKPLYLSNILEIFEKNMGVIHANIRLEPEIVDKSKINVLSFDQYKNNTSNLFYDPSPKTNPIYNKTVYKLSNGLNPIANTINQQLRNYLSTTTTSSTKIVDEWDIDIFTMINVPGFGGSPGMARVPSSIEDYSYSFINSVSERSFYVNFVGPLYTAFKNAALSSNPGVDYKRFIGLSDTSNSIRTDVLRSSVVKSDFAKIMEQIHNDLSYIIRHNLLDSHGNIDVEYDKNNVFVRGGYTLGSEIIQVLGNSTYTDDAGNKVPFLNFRYK